MTHLKELSSKLRLIFKAIYWVTPLALVTYLLIMMRVSPNNALLIYGPLHHAPNASKTLLFCALIASFLPAIPFMKGLKQLISLFENYQIGHVFTRRNAASYRNLSRSILAWVLLGVLGSTLATLIITLNNGPGKHVLSLTFVGSDVITLVLSGVFLLLSTVMFEAQVIADENAKTI